MAKKKKRSGRKIEGIPVEDIDKPCVGSPVIARGGVPLNITPRDRDTPSASSRSHER